MNSTVFIFVIFTYVAWASMHNSNVPDPETLLNDLKQARKQLILPKFRTVLEENWPWKVSLDDHLLLRFLTAKDFDLLEAFRALKDHLIFRKAFNVDNIMDEDWSDMEELFPYDVLVSFQNRKQESVVTLQIYLGKWDLIRNYDPVSKEANRYTRYITAKMMEDADRRLRSLTSADNNPKFSVIVDLEGFRVTMEGGAVIADDSRDLIELCASHWKEATDKFVFINAPHVPDFICTWSAEGELACPSKYSVKVDNHRFNLRGVEF